MSDLNFQPDEFGRQTTIPEGDTGQQRDGGLANDSRYRDVLEMYQAGEWVNCETLIDLLLQDYPGNEKLLAIKSDIDLKRLVLNIDAGEKSSVRKKQKISWLIVSGVIVVMISVITFVWYRQYQQRIKQENLEQQALIQNTLDTLEEQFKLAIQSNQPAVALQVIEQIKAVDPAYPLLPGYQIQADEQVQLEEDYKQAITEMSAGNFKEALAILTAIQQRDSSYRDVNYQVQVAGNELAARGHLLKAETAFGSSLWEEAITEYSGAVSINPEALNPEAKDKLLTSYLNRILEILSLENPAIEDIEKAGSYYQKALALIPQDSRYISRREDLRKLSQDMLVIKNQQIARKILEDPNHTEYMVGKAIAFLRTAYQLDTKNTEISRDISKAQKYLEGLSFFNKQQWEEAIRPLEELIQLDADYPNGMAKVMLYEAYMFSGTHFYQGGFYLDAQKRFERAEVLSWGSIDNKLRLFEAEIMIGLTLGRLEDYKNGVSYIIYAFTKTNESIYEAGKPEIIRILIDAQKLNDGGKYKEAFDMLSEMIDQNQGTQAFFQVKSVEATPGETLIFLAERNYSTVSGIIHLNETGFPLITTTLELMVPYLP